MGGVLENTNPAVFGTVSDRKVLPEEEDDDIRDEIDAREIFDILFWCIPGRVAISVWVKCGPAEMRTASVAKSKMHYTYGTEKNAIYST